MMCSSIELERTTKTNNRCILCKKKVYLTYFSCICNREAIFCSKHRYPHSHECSYDYKTKQQVKLTKENPIIVKEKFEKI